LSGTALSENVGKTIVVSGIQKSIEDVGDVNLFFSVIDWSGKIISHPDITKVGTTDAATNAMVANIKKDISAEDLYVYITEYQQGDNQEESEKEAEAQENAIDQEGEEAIKDLPKKRLLTYIRNELMPVSIEDISYIYLENTITYIIRKDGKRFTANDSLDQIYSSLDGKLFFRANRQIIVHKPNLRWKV